MDSKALELSRKLETAVLGERREELLWKATRDRQHLEQRDAELYESENIVKDLKSYTTSQEETLLLTDIGKRLENVKIVTQEDASIPIERISLLADGLLSAIDDYAEVNNKQIEETMKASKSLNSSVDIVTVILLLFVALVGIAGSLMLINQIVKPIIALKKTAERFGRGDLSLRIPVGADDELGMLCNTFNDMAGNISSLEKDRLNFFASVAHDLKNPLIVIGGAARRVQKNKADSTEGSKWLHCIIEQIANLENVINDLMDSIQVEMGKLKLNTSNLELSSLLHSVQEIYNETVETHQIVLEQEEKCRIKGDVKRLERVLSNLISNAVKYSPTGSTIALKVKASDNNAVITISDEGSGIPLQDTKKLFQPFERLDQNRAMVMGTGLGLFSAKMIIELHGGTINIYRKVEKGTTVEITLPIITHKEREEFQG
jgi:signal transduction histidine kinase